MRKLFLQQRDPTKINALGILALYLPWVFRRCYFCGVLLKFKNLISFICMAALLFFIDRDVCFIKNYERATAEREKPLFQYFSEIVCTSIPSQCLTSKQTLIKLGKPSIVNIRVLADPELFSCFS